MIRPGILKFIAGTNRFVGRHPLFVAAMIAVLCVLAADYGLMWGLLGVAACAAAGWYSGSGRRSVVFGLCGLLAVGVFSVRKASREGAEKSLVGTGGTFGAKLLEDAKGTTRWSAPARLMDGEGAGAEVWWEGTGTPPVAGSVVKGQGNFVRLRAPRNPGEFDEAGWRRRKGMVASFENRTLETRVGKWAAKSAEIRHGFRYAVTAGLDEESRPAQVIRAIVVGETPADADELVAAFRNSGTLHIFSVSGMHVAMVGGICWLVLQWLGISRRTAVLVILPLVFGYAWITGNSAPAVRSAWMMAVFLMAFVFQRRPDLLNALGAVLLAAMLWDGNLLFQPGVQLSYGVVAAIAAGAAWAGRGFSWIAKKEEYLPDDMYTGWRGAWLRCRQSLALFLGTSAAAWVGSTPLTIFHFGLVTPVAFIANFFLGPLVFAILALALAAAAFHPFAPKVSEVVDRGNAKVADICVGAAETLAALPGSHFSTRSPGEPMLRVYDLEYGAGAACFTGKDGGAVLFDCADARSFRYQLVRSLRESGIEPDSVVLSHPDGGHLGGGREVWRAFPVRQVLLPVDKARSSIYRDWVEEAPKAGIRTLRLSEVGPLPLPDGARLEVLHVPDPHAMNAQADSRVAIYRLDWRSWKILFTSDSGLETEGKLLRSGRDISADVIVAGHHRTDISLGDAFLDAVSPQAIIVSHSDFPKEERRDPKQVAYWRARGLKVLNQAETGGVTVRIDKNGDLILEGFVDRSVLRLKRR